MCNACVPALTLVIAAIPIQLAGLLSLSIWFITPVWALAQVPLGAAPPGLGFVPRGLDWLGQEACNLQVLAYDPHTDNRLYHYHYLFASSPFGD
ncbi:hypothetical protein VP01_2901g1 [Puccinia sorghi]|uniref:Uncharacterized protein n=1 Tax=Puccinia sorghi TaxID=27349 RepID=A0A0L6V3B6_9BASI|nr:hypothetical protein VP01_2901g1 [Puccinia sorghi]